MNHDKPRFDDLNDDALEQVAGGMTCEQGIIAAKVYGALDVFYGSVGMPGTGLIYAGKGIGVLQGACS